MPIIKEQMAFLGYQVYGGHPFSVKSREKTVVCYTAAENRAMLIGIGVIFGPLIILQFVLKPESWNTTPLFFKGVLLFFVAVSFYAIYSGIFMKRELVFNGTDGSIEFYKNKKLSSKIIRDQIRSFEITAEFRQSSTAKGGSIQWTAHIYWVLLANGERQPLLESWKEGPTNEVDESVRLLFKIERPAHTVSSGT